MLLLNAAKLAELKHRRADGRFEAVWQNLVAQAKPLTAQRPPVPPAGIANWAHYFFCPEHHAPIEFDPHDQNNLRCSFGGELLTAKVYQDTWWRKVNIYLAEACLSGAVLAVADYQPELPAEYAAGIAQILLDYAEVYPSYAIHGDIPYNGPGKANAQTLDEGTWILPLVTAYDLVRDRLNAAVCAKIERDLFLECANFLVAHREKQLHNHQCWISAAIAAIGLLLNRQNLIQSGLHGEWGLLTQLEQGVLADGNWLEGAAGYHFYAFEAFTAYARLAYHTEFALHQHPSLKKMPYAILQTLLPDKTFPLFNDTVPPRALANAVANYELATGWYAEPAYYWVLHEVYNLQQRPRTALNALLFGADEIKLSPPSDLLETDYSSPESGLTILRQTATRANLAYLAVKHSPFGGEHDHMDRLSLSFGSPQVPRLSADLGTVPYSLPLHYGYFKTSLTNNTVSLANQNQPPANAKLVELRQTASYSLVSSRCDWATDAGYPYGGVTFRRVVLAAEGYLLDVFAVNAPTITPMQYAMHWQARLSNSSAALFSPGESAETSTVNRWFSAVGRQDGAANLVTAWQDEETNEEVMRVWAAGKPGQQFQVARAPDNPFTRRGELSYWLVQIEAKNHCFIHLFEFGGAKAIQNFQITYRDADIIIGVSGATVATWSITKLNEPREDLLIC
jgi:Heparinase II/III-like protein/Heparinase II/III N-terminus